MFDFNNLKQSSLKDEMHEEEAAEGSVLSRHRHGPVWLPHPRPSQFIFLLLLFRLHGGLSRQYQLPPI